MEYIVQFFSNKIILGFICSCLFSQILKFIIYIIMNRKLDIRRLLGDGGMPSSHSCLVTTIATLCAYTYGLDSFEFGISLLLASIVMHDAKGVRYETGKQSKIINELTEIINNITDLTTDFTEQKLKEFVGHTPLQVYVGALLGLGVGTFVYYLFS